MPQKPGHENRLKNSGETRAKKKTGSLGAIINASELQSIMDDFHKLTGMVTAILDMDGNIIESTGWQDICTKFHRVHPETAKNCTESDLHLASELKPGEYREYRCKNGLWDVVTPLYIGRRHVGNIYTGQFFYEDDLVDENRFVRQAEKYGFDKDAYLKAFRRIPVYSREMVRHLMSFLVKFSSYISTVSYTNLKLESEVHERKKAERDLMESEGQMRSLINTMPDLVWLKDLNGAYLSCNSRFEKFFGATEKEIVGKTDYEFLDQAKAEFFRSYDQAAMEKGGPNINEEEITFASDGHREILETIKTPMFSIDGTALGVLGIGRDITERKRAQEEQERLQAQLNQAQKMESVGRLAGGVAHDFNNILGVILGHAELMIEQIGAGDPLRASLEEIHKAAERSAALTRQLLAFARKQTISPKILDLNETVGSLTKMMQRLIGEDIDLVWHPGKGLAPVKIDPGQIDQVLANLCVNARDAVSGVGKVTIETASVSFDDAYCGIHPEFHPGEYVMLAVSDTGCGMDDETRTSIFEPFFTTKEQGKGTGLGLSTVYGVVKQNNGFVHVYSEPGRGTSFKIYFPQHLEGNAPLKKSVSSPRMAPGSETILLVEDESAILKMTVLMLERDGYTVLTASTPGEAIARSGSYPDEIHLLMTDVVMPEMNGHKLAKEILRSRPHIKCLYMSGYTANVIAHHGVLDENVNFIQKPFSRKQLGITVRAVLDENADR